MDQHSLGFKLTEPACKEIMLPMQYCCNLLEFSVFSNNDDETVMIRPLTDLSVTNVSKIQPTVLRIEPVPPPSIMSSGRPLEALLSNVNHIEVTLLWIVESGIKISKG